MTWIAVIALTVAVWGQRLLGGFIIGPALERRPLLTQAASLLPAAVVMAVIVQLSVTRGGDLVVDARLAGMTVAAFLVWRRAPFLVVVLAAAAVTALLRAL